MRVDHNYLKMYHASTDFAQSNGRSNDYGLNMLSANQTYVTILFADIAGSTRLYEQLGDMHALELVNACVDMIHDVANRFHGSVVKTIGDEVMCCFHEPDQAGSAAMSMHETITTDPKMSNYSIRLRIGLHHGSVIMDEGDLYGDAVNVAARMVGQAKASQIITTKHTLDMMGATCQKRARLVDQTRVKGKQALMEIFEIAWGQPEELTMISTYAASRFKSDGRPDTLMVLQFKNQKIIINQKMPVVTIGRDTTNHLVVEDPRVSRLHARIELRRDKFVLVDQSTNGTYILPGDGEIVLMRRDEIVLPNKGTISVGQQILPNSPMMIRFQII